MTSPQKYLCITSALMIAVVGGFGFYLIGSQPKIESLASSGHAHVLLFAYGAILYALLLDKIDLGASLQKKLAVLMSLTFLGPLDLIYAGVTGNTSLLKITSPLFMGLFVALWLILSFYIAGSKKAK